MSREAFDDTLVRGIILEAIGPYKNFREAREHGVNVTIARDRVIELCVEFAPAAINKLAQIPRSSRIERDDLLQAAVLGIIESLDSFQPRKTYKGQRIKVVTHIFWRVRKRVYKEVEEHHWNIMKPAQRDAEAYMQGKLDPDAHEKYNLDFMTVHQVPGTDPVE